MAIKILDNETINKIAAGEVIERPANALKELLENSADSGATKVEIDFDGGGKKEIKVTDDGCGISQDQVTLALERHATSKISKISDLDSLHTFGFRGEALSSLASVSDLELHTSTHDHDTGTKVIASGGVIKLNLPAAPLKGTQISVKNIFFNVPARLKFLKSDAGETAAIKKVVKSFALIHPELHVTLRQGGKVIGHWERETFKKRAQRMLSVTDEESIYLKVEDNDLKLEALLLLPQHSVNTQGGIFLFVQGRPVSDRTMQQAVLEGYRSLLMQHQYPQVVLSLHMDPTQVDINVHPAKAQVKFLSPGTIFRFINSAIKDALAKKMGMPKFENAPVFSREVQTAFIEDAVTQYNQKSLNLDRKLSAAPENFEPKVFKDFQSATPLSVRDKGDSPVAIENASELVSSLVETQPQQSVWSSIQVIGQYANTYMIGQSRNSLVLIDQHAAHERVLFERLKKSWGQGEIEKQASLFDETLTLPREAIEAITSDSISEVFTKMGFELTDRGPTTLGIATRPAFLVDIGLQPLFEKLSEQVLEVNSISSIEDLLNDLWASMSCHGAVRAGKVLSLDEMKSLLMQMDEFSFSHFCPHGRPVSINWNLYDLEKLFRRIV